MSTSKTSGTSSTAKAAAIALKSSVVMGGTAILSAVNGLTPHMAGAIDIMVVQQPDGSMKCSPFYVRFGKYTPMRSKDKRVQILINGEDSGISMHLGAYGQAYFAAETMEIVSDADDEELLQGMMSPPSGYSSDEDAPYANEEMVSAVQQEVQRIKANQEAAAAATVAAVTAAVVAGASSSKAGADEQSAAAAAKQQQLAAVPSGGTTADSGTESDTESSSGLDDVSLSVAEITSAIQQGLGDAAAAASSSALPAGTAVLPNSSGIVLGSQHPSSARRRSSKQHRRHGKVLTAAGDGAAEDPARAALQDLLLDNKYSIKVKSDESFVADGLDQTAAARQQRPRAKSRSQQQQQQQQQEEDGDLQQAQQPEHRLHNYRKPVRHIGFEVSLPAEASSAADGAASVRQVQQGQLAEALDSTASYSVDEAPSSYRNTGQGEDSPARSDSEASVTSPSLAAAPALQHWQQPSQGNDGVEEPTRKSSAVQQPLQQVAAAEQQTLTSPSSSRNGLLAASLKAVQGQQQQQQQQPEGTVAAAGQHDSQQQGQQRLQTVEQPSAVAADMQQQQPPQQQQQQLQVLPTTSSSSSSNLVPDEADATAYVDEADSAAAAQTGATSTGAGGSTLLQELTSIAVPPAQTHTDQQGLQEAAAAAAPAAAADGSLSSLQPSTPTKASVDGASASSPAPHTAAAGSSGVALTAAATPDDKDAAVKPSTPVAVPKTLAANGPMTVSGSLAASPGVDAGCLGDNELGGALGISYEGSGTPRVRRGSVGPADIGASGSGPLALGLAGFQMSLCGGLLRPEMAASEVQQVFETQRVSAGIWAERGVSLMGDPDLVVKIGGSIYSWQVAAPMVVGMLAFGGKWDNLLGLDPTGMYPIKLGDDHSSTAKKPGSSSWRLWPFTGWREAGSSSSKTAPALGSSPPPPAAAEAAAAQDSSAGPATSEGITPAGGSFSNLLSLVGGVNAAQSSAGSASKAATPPYLDKSAPGSLSAPAAVRLDGGSPRAGAVAGSPPRISRKKHIIIIRKTLTPTSEQLSRLPLRPGSNTITFRSSGAADLTAYIYLLRWDTRLVVSDVDGTITRSDLLGHVLPTLGVDWSHPGITQLFHNIDSNGYQIMFLSSRAIAQANITREYLHSLVQDGYKMPAGPVIISPHGLLPSLYREIVVRRPHEFKIACLQDIRALFPPDWNPFYAGFGNRDTDEVSYREVGVPLGRTFTINPKGQIQKAATPVQSSTWSSLSAINDLVHELFPPMPSISRHTSRALAVQHSSRRIGDMDVAALAGIVPKDTIEAAIAAQERQRSSTTGDVATPAAADNLPAAAAAEGKPTAAAGSMTAATNIAVDATAAGAVSGGSTSFVAAAAPGTPIAAAVAAAAAAAAVSSSLEVEDVGPPREEFADLQYWKPAFSIDIGEELMRMERKQQQRLQQQQQMQQHSGAA